jgi:peptidoglycan/xylan/chitin deacetylase (PgdA/CDA1 family)
MTTGAWRLLNIVREMKVPAGCYASGIIAEKWPDLLAQILKDSHFLAAHPWTQNVLLVHRERDEDADDIARQLAASDAAVGHRSTGFGSPRGTNSPIRSNFWPPTVFAGPSM